MRLTLIPMLVLTAFLLPLAIAALMQPDARINHMADRMMAVITEMKSDNQTVEKAKTDQDTALADQLNNIDVGAGK